MKLTKKDIEQMANDIMCLLLAHYLEEDVSIYFNNKRMDKDGIEEDINPKDYLEYAANNHILSMSFEGRFNHILNDYLDATYCDFIINKFNDILNEYHVYYELGNSWNLTCYPADDDLEVEYTYYESEPEPIRIWNNEDETIPKCLRQIRKIWEVLQKRIGDVGSCVVCAGFEFTYEGKRYFMTPPGFFQGSISWETDKDAIHEMLEIFGATEIRYDWGVMD